MIRLSRVFFPVTALGPGRRLGVWLQGCPLACAGCMSLDTWDADGGCSIEVPALLDIWQAALDEGAEGLTVSGGEPLTQAVELTAFLAAARELAVSADILLYTGFEPSEWDGEQREAAGLADAVITGRYDVREPSRLIWRGSANQELLIGTELGRRIYARYLSYRPDRAPLQVSVDDERRLSLIGVPPSGALRDMEKTLRDNGVLFERVGWRR